MPPAHPSRSLDLDLGESFLDALHVYEDASSPLDAAMHLSMDNLAAAPVAAPLVAPGTPHISPFPPMLVVENISRPRVAPLGNVRSLDMSVDASLRSDASVNTCRDASRDVSKDMPRDASRSAAGWVGAGANGGSKGAGLAGAGPAGAAVGAVPARPREWDPPSVLNGYGVAAFSASIETPPPPPPPAPPPPPPTRLAGPMAFSDAFIAEAAAAGVRLRSLFDTASKRPPPPDPLATPASSAHASRRLLTTTPLARRREAATPLLSRRMSAPCFPPTSGRTPRRSIADSPAPSGTAARRHSATSSCPAPPPSSGRAGRRGSPTRKQRRYSLQSISRRAQWRNVDTAEQLRDWLLNLQAAQAARASALCAVHQTLRAQRFARDNIRAAAPAQRGPLMQQLLEKARAEVGVRLLQLRDTTAEVVLNANGFKDALLDQVSLA